MSTTELLEPPEAAVRPDPLLTEAMNSATRPRPTPPSTVRRDAVRQAFEASEDERVRGTLDDARYD